MLATAFIELYDKCAEWRHLRKPPKPSSFGSYLASLECLAMLEYWGGILKSVGGCSFQFVIDNSNPWPIEISLSSQAPTAIPLLCEFTDRSGWTVKKGADPWRWVPLSISAVLPLL